MVTLSSALIYSVRFRTLGKYLGQLLLILAVLTLIPLGVALLHQDFSIAKRYATVILPLGLLGISFSKLRAPRQIQSNEAMVLVCLIFILGPLFMIYPLMGSGLSAFDAFFEAVSGVTTTGLSILPSTNDIPPSFLFSRSWMQWYGGLGIVVLSLAWVIPPGKIAKTLALSESKPDDLVGTTRAFARRILLTYVALTLFGILILWILNGNFYVSVLYTLTSVSTGGFSPHDQSLAHFSSWPPQAFITLLTILCAVSLNFYFTLVFFRRSGIIERVQFMIFLGLGIIIFVPLSYFISQQFSFSISESLLHGFLNGFSAQSTSGFSSLNIAEFNNHSKLLLIFSMLIGGCVGSTAGGLKLLRLWAFLAFLKYLLNKISISPHGVTRPCLWNKTFSDEEILWATTLSMLYLGTIFFSWLTFVFWDYPPLDSLFEVVSATGTVGLSSGISGPNLPVFLKGVLCIDMLLGRLEIVAWLVLLYPRTWWGRKTKGIL